MERCQNGIDGYGNFYKPLKWGEKRLSYAACLAPQKFNSPFRADGPHRKKAATPLLPACVARPVPRAELEKLEDARKDRKREWASLQCVAVLRKWRPPRPRARGWGDARTGTRNGKVMACFMQQKNGDGGDAAGYCIGKAWAAMKGTSKENALNVYVGLFEANAAAHL